MSKADLKNIVGCLIIFSQVIALILPAIIAPIYNGFTDEEAAIIPFLIFPILGSFSSEIIFRHLYNNPGRRLSQIHYSRLVAYGTLIVILVLVLLLVGSIILKSLGLWFSSFHDFIMAFGTIQTLFGLIVTPILSNLFKTSES